MNKNIIVLFSLFLFVAQTNHAQTKISAPESPFGFETLEMYDFPARDFPITKFGARAGDVAATTLAFKKAMAACNRAGGGRVVVPAGEWLTGPVHFLSNCNLFLSKGSVLVFDDDKELYLPAVQTSWEGMECMNWSPLLYAFECENIAITGPGKLAPKMDFWKTWFSRPESHMKASYRLYSMASTDVDVKHRDMTEGEANMRPHLIHLNRCTNVQLGDFSIYQSPFWTIHLFLCKDVWVHGIDNYAHGHNSDGLDVEMTRHVLIEDCTFDQGDDGICLKSGRNRDAWRLDTPTADVVVRNCHIRNAGAVCTLGSELSGGIQRVYVHDCTGDYFSRALSIKTNERRGGLIEDIAMENIKGNGAKGVLHIRTDVVFQWKNVPTYEVRLTEFRNIRVSNVEMKSCDFIYSIEGDGRIPVKGVTLENIKVGEVNKYVNYVNNCYDLTTKNISYGKIEIKDVKRQLPTEMH